MSNWVTRTAARWHEAGRRRRDAAHLARLPDYLLRDIGLRPDGEASLARQLRSDERH
jgi:uncharacterized protein YjiS (DUF1127 family)